MRPSALRSSALILVATASFGTIGTARVLGPTAPAGSVGAVRLLLAAIVLVALAAAQGHRPDSWRRELRRPSTVVAGLAQAAFQVTFLAAVVRTGVAVGTLVAIGSAPVIAGLMTRQVTREWATATGVAVAGLALLVLGGGGARLSPGGLLLALGGGAAYATYTVGTSRAVGQGASPGLTTAVAFTVAAVALTPWLALEDHGWLGSGAGWLMAGYLALLPTVLAYRLFAHGLHGVAAATASTLGLAEPVVATLLGVSLLGEHLAVAAWVGAGLVLVGLVLVARSAARRSPVGQEAGRADRTAPTRDAVAPEPD